MAKAKATGAKAAWQALTGGRGYMGISLNSSNHRSDGLAAMVDWVNHRGNFTEFRVGLSDTLNRFNFAQDRNISLRDAYTMAAREGDLWLTQNKPILERLNMPFRVTRWSHWLENHRDTVERNRVLFRRAYNLNPAFRASVDADIDAFLRRKSATPDSSTRASCRNYLVEELAVYSVILDTYPATVIYPGKQLNCFAYLRDEQPADLPPAIGRSGHIRLAIHGLDRTKRLQHPATRVA